MDGPNPFPWSQIGPKAPRTPSFEYHYCCNKPSCKDIHVVVLTVKDYKEGKRPPGFRKEVSKCRLMHGLWKP